MIKDFSRFEQALGTKPSFSQSREIVRLHVTSQDRDVICSFLNAWLLFPTKLPFLKGWSHAAWQSLNARRTSCRTWPFTKAQNSRITCAGLWPKAKFLLLNQVKMFSFFGCTDMITIKLGTAKVSVQTKMTKICGLIQYPSLGTSVSLKRTFRPTTSLSLKVRKNLYSHQFFWQKWAVQFVWQMESALRLSAHRMACPFWSGTTTEKCKLSRWRQVHKIQPPGGQAADISMNS